MGGFLRTPDWQKQQTGKQVGLDGIPNKLYCASGKPGQLLLAQLLHHAAQRGPPMAWKGRQMWAAPRKTWLPLSPFKSRAVFCAGLHANHFAAPIRRALARTLQWQVTYHQS